MGTRMGKRGCGTRNMDTIRSATTSTSLLRAWRRSLCGSCHGRRTTTLCARRLGGIVGCPVLRCGWLGRLCPNRGLGWLRSRHIAFHLPFQALLIVNTSVLVDEKERDHARFRLWVRPITRGAGPISGTRLSYIVAVAWVA